MLTAVYGAAGFFYFTTCGVNKLANDILSGKMSAAIKIEHLYVSYGTVSALTDINLTVPQKEYLGIIGPNGGGKSTLLKSILGLVPADSGAISVLGRKPGKTGTLVGYVPQFSSVERQFPITVREAVLTGRVTFGGAVFHRYSRADREAADKALVSVGIAQLAGRGIDALSGGQFQKMLIARALAVGPKILMLDEPTASVDTSSREQIFALLAELNKNMTIILVTHDAAAAAQVHRVACLNNRLVYHGRPAGLGNGAAAGMPETSAVYGGTPAELRKHERGKRH
jgi:zinc transport system ATP-binding protein